MNLHSWILALTSLCLLALAGWSNLSRPSIESCAEERAGEITLPYNDTLKHKAHGFHVEGKYIPNPHYRGEKTKCVAALHNAAESNRAALLSAESANGVDNRRQLTSNQQCQYYIPEIAPYPSNDPSAVGNTANQPSDYTASNPTRLSGDTECWYPSIYDNFKTMLGWQKSEKRHTCLNNYNVQCTDPDASATTIVLYPQKAPYHCLVRCIKYGTAVVSPEPR